jgi:hypothetical protein
MSTFILLRPARDQFQRLLVNAASSLFTLATSALIVSIQPSLAVPTTPPNYVPPARETPLRTESAGVRLGEEKGPSTVTQNTIAIERLIVYRPVIAPILDWLQVLLPATVPQKLFKVSSIQNPKSQANP